VRLYSRPGNDLTQRFPLLADALARLRAASCIIDGEAVAGGPDGIPSFDGCATGAVIAASERPSHATSHGQTRDTWAHQRVG
jgi:ATP-dependent DNA ligase